MHFEGSQKRMEDGKKMVEKFTELPNIVEGMSILNFEGLLDHKNPTCEQCGSHCYALYRGGKKERMADLFVCKNCSILYTLPSKKKCEFTEVQTQ